MTVFDSFFYTVFQHYKPTYKKNANTIALFYVSSLQCSLVLISGLLISLFLNEMNSFTISSDKAWPLFIMICIFLHFKNWIQYGGKKRKILNAKRHSKLSPKTYNIWSLWLLLIACIAFIIMLLYAF